MAEKLFRAQVLLEPKQHDALRELAEAERRSISDVVREMIDIGLASLEEQKARQRAALDRLAALRSEIARQHGVLSVQAADIISEVRAERERQLDEALEDWS